MACLLGTVRLFSGELCLQLLAPAAVAFDQGVSAPLGFGAVWN
jgi:hypothetical protein